jgi:hypothetical protein
VQTIVARSVEANNADWKAAPGYDHYEQDRTGSGTETYHVRMILGSPYKRLVAVNGKPLPPLQQAEQQHNLEETLSQRRNESPSETEERIAKWERGREQNHLLMQQLTKALRFKLLGQQRLGGREVYVLEATPRPGYQPPNRDTEVLTGMRGRLWIDARTFQWAKVEARVVHPVWIGGFLARVEPGTRFELTNQPVGDGIWLPKRFVMKSRAKVLFFFTLKTQQESTYFGYEKAGREDLQQTDSTRPPLLPLGTGKRKAEHAPGPPGASHISPP